MPELQTDVLPTTNPIDSPLIPEPLPPSVVLPGIVEPVRISDASRPAWMQGKTLDEIADITQNLYTDYVRMGQQSYSQPNVQPPEEHLSVNTVEPDHNLIYSNPAEYQRQLLRYQQIQFGQQLASASGPIADRLALSDRQQSRSGQYQDVWNKWEPEVERKLAGIALGSRSFAIYEQAAALVRSDHFEEIAQARAEKIAALNGSGTERSSSGGSSPQFSASDKLEAIYDTDHPFFENAREQRVTKDMIRDHCKAMKISVDQYVANATLGNVIVSKNGFERRSE